MTALMITGAAVLLLLVLLLARVKVDILAREDGTTVRVRYLLLRLRVLPEPEKSEKQLAKRRQKDEKKKQKREKKQAKTEKERRSLGDMLELVRQVVLGSRKGVRTLRRHLVFSRVRVYVAVGGEDAHQTALRYSHTCMLAAAALDVVGVLFVLKKPETCIRPAFTAPQTKYEIAARVAIRPVHLLTVGLRIFFPLLGVLMKSQKSAAVPANKKPMAKTA